MKTLSKSNGLKKLEKLVNSVRIIKWNDGNGESKIKDYNKSQKSYQFVKKAIQSGEKTIRPAYTNGSGKYTSNQDHTSQTCKILKELGIEFVLTNDAPRGSVTGNLITITTKIK